MFKLFYSHSRMKRYILLTTKQKFQRKGRLKTYIKFTQYIHEEKKEKKRKFTFEKLILKEKYVVKRRWHSFKLEGGKRIVKRYIMGNILRFLYSLMIH